MKNDSQLDRKSIRGFVKKIKIIEYIQESHKIKCSSSNCDLGADIKFLPALDLHHKNPLTKKFSLSAVIGYQLPKIMEILSDEDVGILCINCHRIIGSNTFNQYKELILDENLLNKTPLEIDKAIEQEIGGVEEKNKTKYEIKKWIKKRSIIEQLFGGKCVGCGIITVKNNLPALSFHHRNPELKENLWSQKLKFLEIKEISEVLIEEEIICLCSNCHRMINSHRFESNYKQIFIEAQNDTIDFIQKEVQDYYKKLHNNIDTFKFEKKYVKEHLKLLFQWHRGDFWKLYLIHVYGIIKLKNQNLFTRKDVAYSLNLEEIQRNQRRPFQQLVRKDYIAIIDENTFEHKFYLTKLGSMEVKKILHNFKKISEEDHNTILKQIKIEKTINFKKLHKELRTILSQKLYFGEGWKNYLIHIYKIVQEKGKNEVKSNELRESLDVVKDYSFTNERNPLQKLIKNGLVLEIKSNSSLPSVFILTNLGVKKAQSISSEINSMAGFKELGINLNDFIEGSNRRLNSFNKHLLYIHFINQLRGKNLFSMKELAEFLSYKAIQSNMITKLIDNELIELKNQKGRVNIYSLTPKGLKISKEIWDDFFPGIQPEDI